jgi:hypothetical protein
VVKDRLTNRRGHKNPPLWLELCAEVGDGMKG